MLHLTNNFVSFPQVRGMARQKVRPSVELLSNSVAVAMERYLDGAHEEARVVRLFDSAFDVLNAIHPGDRKPLRRGYRGSPEQEAVLDQAVTEATLMRVGRAKHLLPFQKGMIATIRSVRGLLRDLQSEYGESTYLMTRRLSQDKLESFFGMVRGRGGSSLNPTPTEAKARLRLLTLLFAMKRGVNPFAREDVPNDQEQRDEDAEMAEHLREMEELAAQGLVNPEITADLAEFAGPEEIVADSDDDESDDSGDDGLDELNGLMEELNNPQCQPSGSGAAPATLSLGALDRETGVPAAASGMAHVAGFVASKRPADRSVGAPSSADSPAPMEALWTRLISLGGLTVPTEDFYARFLQMETQFCMHHAGEPDNLSTRPGVIADFRRALVSKFPDLDLKICSTFARVRTFIQINHINARRKAASEEKRAAKKRKHHAQ